jgi:hypothetical protein
LLIEQTGSEIQTPILVMLIFWLTMIFASFGLFAPRNLTVICAHLICSASVAGAVFLLLELDSPAGGLIQISNAPLQEAAALIGL